MKTCYFDAFSGISGDMTVGALLDVGAGGAELIDALQSLNLRAAFSFEKTRRRGIGATKFHVEGGVQKEHRHLPHIFRIIENASRLSDRTKERALAVFGALGAAEAKVHNQPLEMVHFHEVGAVDSIADIVGSCLGLELLGVDEIFCSRINVGSGVVETEHGTLPVPAPATAELLVDKPVYSQGPSMELTTPTGAAIVSALAKGFGPMPAMTIQQTGFGAGSKDFPMQANVLRAIIGQRTAAVESTAVTIIEANIDDSTPQVLGYAMDRLFAAGALDVTLQPLLMKKNRQGTLLSVIARPEDQESLAQVVLQETTTLGVRLFTAERRVQARSEVTVETPYGKVRMKVTAQGASPEYDDCRKLAAEQEVPLKKVLAEAQFAYWKEF
ncbi:MAG TPA: nickel pincer cofactor biosynthesis protein LarC [Bryobacteraceae bacterium]|nr:nickel pincer cofactor biosynthesis protein LarC [Bryobacteraceae bacterium]